MDANHHQDETDHEHNVSLLCDGQILQCNRARMAEESPYFKAMFYGQLRESQSNDPIPLHDVSAITLQTLIDCSELKTFVATAENAFDMLEAATLFQFDAVQQACIQFIKSNLEISNCLDAMSTADFLSIESMYRMALHFALWEFETVRQRPEMLCLWKDALVSYLSEDGLRTPTEMNVFRCLSRWVEHDQENRQEHLFELLCAVRYGELSTADLEEMLDSKVMKDLQSLELIQRIRELRREGSRLLKSNTESNRLAKSLLKSTPRRIRKVPILLCHLYKDIQSDPVPDIAYYDAETKMFHKLATLHKVYRRSVVLTGFILTVVGQEMFVTERTHSWKAKDVISLVWSYNLLTEKWKICTSIPIPRRLFSTCVIDDRIYVIGGTGTDRMPLSDVCRFDPGTGNWETLQPLPEPMFAHYCSASTEHRGLIYVFEDEVYRYDPVVNAWTSECKLPKVTVRIALSHDKNIYFITKTRLLFLYHPVDEGSPGGGTYTVLGRFVYSLGAACVVNDEVFAFNYDKSNCCIVEVYNPATNELRVEFKSDVGAPETTEVCPMISLM